MYEVLYCTSVAGLARVSLSFGLLQSACAYLAVVSMASLLETLEAEATYLWRLPRPRFSSIMKQALHVVVQQTPAMR